MQKYTFKILSILGIFSVVFLHGTSSAQVPGYIGKRFVVSSDVQLMPSVVGWLLYRDEDNFSAMNYRPGLNVEYVISRRASVSAGFHIFNTYLSFPKSVYYRPYYFDIAPERLKGADLELSYSFYLSGLAAPLGNFLKLSYTGVSASPDYNYNRVRKKIEKHVPDNTISDIGIAKPSSLSPTRTSVFSLEYGRQRIFRNAISFRYSGGMGFETHTLVRTMRDRVESDMSFSKEYLDLMSKRRVFSTYLFSFKLGIGYVL